MAMVLRFQRESQSDCKLLVIIPCYNSVAVCVVVAFNHCSKLSQIHLLKALWLVFKPWCFLCNKWFYRGRFNNRWLLHPCNNKNKIDEHLIVCLTMKSLWGVDRINVLTALLLLFIRQWGWQQNLFTNL